MAEDTLGVGFIGVGGQGEEQVRAFAALPGIRVRAVCDVDADRAATVAARYGAARWTTDPGELAAFDDLQLVCIATPEAHHREPTLACLAAGKHVLLEKPISTRLDEARVLFEQAERSGCILAPAHVLRFHPAYALLKERIAAGQLGKVVSIAAGRNQPRARAARFHREHSFLEVLVHDIDLAIWYTGDQPERVYAIERKVLHAGPADAVWGMIQFAGGAVATLECHWLWPAGRRSYVESSLRVVGTEETARIVDPSSALEFTNDQGSEVPDTTLWPSVHGVAAGALVNQAAAVVRCIRAGEPFTIVTPPEVLLGLRTALALIRSAHEGREVFLTEVEA
ncbi:MAG TPA: Gfo/Idh/MocA family oxidoreductase [Chloroflexota bacterium]|jgi:predicted dehydrogenase